MNFLTEKQREQTTARIFADIGCLIVACDRCDYRRVIRNVSPVEARMDHARRIALAHSCLDKL